MRNVVHHPTKPLEEAPLPWPNWRRVEPYTNVHDPYLYPNERRRSRTVGENGHGHYIWAFPAKRMIRATGALPNVGK